MGEVLKPHGLGGEVAIAVHSEHPERFKAGATLMVGRDVTQANQMRILESRSNRDRMLVRFEGIDDRDGAESLRGSLIFVEATALADLEEDSFWEHEIVGAIVMDRTGKLLGTLMRVLPRLEQDLWEVSSGEAMVLVPAAKDIVVSVDVKEKKIVIDPPLGLFDDAI